MEPIKRCRDDGTVLTVRQTKRKAEQLTKPYYYTAYYYCASCGKMYLNDEFKVENPLLASSLPFSSDKTENKIFDVEIWTDGACSRNGTPLARASWAYVSGTHEEAGLVEGKQTNNVAEATAMLRALEWAARQNYKTIKLHSDSQISLYNVKKQLEKITVNRDVFEKIFTVIEKNNLQVTWIKVPGHADDINNNRADKLANGLVGIK